MVSKKPDALGIPRKKLHRIAAGALVAHVLRGESLTDLQQYALAQLPAELFLNLVVYLEISDAEVDTLLAEPFLHI